MTQSPTLPHLNRNLLAPRYWPSWLVLGLGRLIAALPRPMRHGVGHGLGSLAQHLTGRRKKIAMTNIEICFPQQTSAQRDRLLRQHFHALGHGFVETALAWWAPNPTVDSLTHINGLDNLEAAATTGRGVILLSAHFTPLALGVRVAQQQLDYLGLILNAMYKAPADPIIDHAMQAHRGAHLHGELISHRNVERAIECLKRGEALWFAGDQKAGKRLGVAAEFFGQPVQTHVSIFRIARLTRATLLPYFFRQQADGRYTASFLSPLDSLPSRDEASDAARVNALIEAEVRRVPAQYFWLHRRFRRQGYDPYSQRADKF